MNNGTGQKLHLHNSIEDISPITSQQEVSCQTLNDHNNNWTVQHYACDVSSDDKEPWNECHDIFLLHGTNMGLNGHNYMLNDEYQEVTCVGDRKAGSTKAYAYRCATDYESWTVMPEVFNEKFLQYMVAIKKMDNFQPEDLCQTLNDHNDNWTVQHYVCDVSSDDKEPWNECHDIFLLNYTNMGLNSHNYMLNNEYLETLNVHNDNWTVQHYICDISSDDKEPWNECHDIFLLHHPNMGL
ncbi:hypothetical protein C2G38_2154172 [Gigaspora rosea]|uniref:Uncharacterized protein n=1 Tax=Gigaspora rosea TaxID=44941 RepID=A0A397W5C8_9GLOM|nr:hypothetical protein C2G38_2154172 [Gigaspora rosea]